MADVTMVPRTGRVVGVVSGHGDHQSALAVAAASVGDGGECVAGLTAGLTACDLVLAVVDGDVGIDAHFAATWARLTEGHVPRCLLVQHSVSGRADFAEVAAMVERVTGDDFVTRYLPLADDDGTSVAGVIDVLSGDVVDLAGRQRAADPEHIAMTHDIRELVIDLLAHSVLDDAALDRYLSGGPLSLPALRDGFAGACAAGDAVVAVVPSESAMSGPVVAAILSHAAVRDVPLVRSDGGTRDADHVTECVGIAIEAGIARAWNCAQPCVCDIVGPNGVVVATRTVSGTLVRDPVIPEGGYLRPAGSDLLVMAPGL